MTMPNLLTQLQDADMLLIDGLHAWQFELSEAPAQLRVECMDGRERRVWVFAAAALAAARHDAGSDSWQLADEGGSHELVILSGITASNDDEDESAANDETPAD
ncbi:hypothetical protein F3I16_07680 [Pseudomonas sp. L-22-4S-12]|nr:hypothetical protein [Pseudomonas sp. L-22-4S-12]